MADTYEVDEMLEAFPEDVEAMDGLESDESDEFAEWRGRRGFRPRVPTGRNLYRPRPQGNYVTQTQLQTALGRVGAQIKASGDATKALSTRFNTLTERVDKEIATRRKEDTALRQDARRGQEMGILPLLLARPSPPEVKTEKITVPGDATGTVKTVEVVTSVTPKKDDSTMLIVLMMMMSSSTGSTAGREGSGDGGGMGGMMAWLPLILLMNR
jgi:hypothetical protein